MVQKTDAELSSQGYKTIAVAAGVEGRWERQKRWDGLGIEAGGW